MNLSLVAFLRQHVLSFLIILCSPTAFLPGCDVQGRASPRVAKVIDGDTVRLVSGETLRYLGLDSPERDAPGYREALAANHELVAGQTLEIQTFEKSSDRFGRLLGIVYRPEAGGETRRCVNRELLALGHGWVYQKNPDSFPEKLKKSFLDAQSEAIRERRGLWANVDFSSPPAGKLLSTRLRIHRIGCPGLRSARASPVSSLEKELQRGKSPCRKCAPLL